MNGVLADPVIAVVVVSMLAVVALFTIIWLAPTPKPDPLDQLRVDTEWAELTVRLKKAKGQCQEVKP
jgi:hypothetical protein